MRKLNTYEENHILSKCSGIECYYCYHPLYIGAISKDDQTPAFYCSNCNFRVAIILALITKSDKEK